MILHCEYHLELKVLLLMLKYSHEVVFEKINVIKKKLLNRLKSLKHDFNASCQLLEKMVAEKVIDIA